MDEKEKDARVKKSMGGTCKLCNQNCPNLVTHKRMKHSNRMKDCPLCGVELEPSTVTCHIHQTHPIQVGMSLTENRVPKKTAMSGEELKTQMEKYGMDIRDAVSYKYFSILYNHDLDCYRWVTYSVTKGLLDSGTDKKRPEAVYTYCERTGGSQVISYTLNQIPSAVEHGHGAPARLYRGDSVAFKESCLFSNISAQRVGFNNGLMSASEHHERNLAEANEIITVLTGPYYDKYSVREDAGCGYDHLIPTGFFKIYVIKNAGESDKYQSFLMPNQPEGSQLFWYMKTIPEIQEMLGYELVPGLRDVSYTWEQTEKTSFCKICNRAFLGHEYPAHQKEHSLAFTCHHNHCFLTFETKEKFEEHKEKFHKKIEFNCKHPNCLFTGFSASDLKIHEEGHKENTHKCNKCPSSFKHVKDLKLHDNQEHDALKNYYCPITDCPAGFAAKNHLENHIVCVHSNIKLFRCTVQDCLNVDKRFGTRILLRRHLRDVHSMDKTEVDQTSLNQTLKKAVETVLIDNLIDPFQVLEISNKKREILKKSEEVKDP